MPVTSIDLVVRYSARRIRLAQIRRKKTVVAVSGVVPVAAVVPVFSTGTYRHYRGTTAVYGCPWTCGSVIMPQLSRRSRERLGVTAR